MNELYFRPHHDGQNLTLFRRMVGIDDQPVRAMRFFDANHLKGVVLNEWTNGGFVPFWQTPIPETGEPPTKVYMDGRAQAAYEVSHFERSNTIRHKSPPKNTKVIEVVKQLAKARNINVKDDAQMYAQLIQAGKKDRALMQRLQRLAQGDPDLWRAFTDYQLQLFMKAAGISRDTPNWPQKLLRHYRGSPDYNAVLSSSANNRRLYQHILEDEGLNVLLLSFKHSSNLINFMLRAKNWRLIYIDDRYTIFIRKEGPLNSDLSEKPLDEFIFPPDIAPFTKGYTLGFIDCNSGNRERQSRGLDTLLQLEEFDYRLFQTIWVTGTKLGQLEKLNNFFLQRYSIYKKNFDSNERFRRLRNINALFLCCHYLRLVAARKNLPDEVTRYQKEYDRYLQARADISAKMSKGWIR